MLQQLTRRNLHCFFAAALCALLLSGCGGGMGVKQQLFPPSMSVQELRIEADGTWSVAFRLQNFSNVGVRMETVEARFDVAGHEAARVSLSPGLVVPASSAELIRTSITPAAVARSGLEEALRSGSVRYQLKGKIRSSEPRSRNEDFDFSSMLNPAPGLENVLR